MRDIFFALPLLFLPLLSISQSTWETNKAKPGTDGCLTYEADANQNRIPNFSHAGYEGGGKEIPTIDIKKTISPISGDNTAHIQDAIDEVAALPIGTDGFRGCIYLEAGRYEVDGQLFINETGVVLRGAGDGRAGTDTTIIYGKGNVPSQRDLIVLGGGSNTMWQGQVSNTKQNITSSFVQVGSYRFEVTNASEYSIGDNIVIYHPCTSDWLTEIDEGETGSDPGWEVDDYPIIYNRYITAISGNEITIDAPVYNHLDLSLAQSYIYTYDRAGLVTNVGIENIRVEIESQGGTDEDHVWNAVQFTQVEDAWIRNATVLGFGLSGVRTKTANHISVINVASLDPVAEVTGGRMYNFNSYVCSNNILFDRCYARNGRHHFVSNGVGSVSGFVVLNSISENPFAAAEGHRHWTTGMLFDNLTDIGTYPSARYVMGFYNRGDYGSGHGWSAAHSVLWNCDVSRPGRDASILVEEPPTAQNYAIGCKGVVETGPFDQSLGYVEGTNQSAELVPNSLYEAQLLCRIDAVIADFEASKVTLAVGEEVTFTANSQGDITDYVWDFGSNANPSTATGEGPHQVNFSTTGTKTISLTVSNTNNSHEVLKYGAVTVSENSLYAQKDEETEFKNNSITTSILDNDSYDTLPINYAYTFDGVDDNITYESTRLFDEYPFTLAAWVKTSSSADQVVLYNGNSSSGITGNSLSIRSGKASLEAWVYSGGTTKEDITGTTTINDGEWHHITGVFVSSSERYLYVDGALEGTDNATLENVTVQGFYMLSVGNREDNTPGDWFEGNIDEVRVYTAAYSESEIQHLMKGWDCTGNEKLLYWNFDDQSTTVAKDEFNYFDGEINGGSSVESEVALTDFSVEIITSPQHGIASLSNDFELSYTPETDYVGVDSVVYQLKIGECDSSSTSVVYQISEVTGVEVLESSQYTIYPNPSTDVVYLTEDLHQNTTGIALYTQTGQLVKKYPIKNQLDLSTVANGIYILRMAQIDGAIIDKKIVVLK